MRAYHKRPLFTAQDLPDLEIDTAIICLSATSSTSLEIIYSSIDDDYRLLLSDVKNGTQFSQYSSTLKSDSDSLSLSDGLVLLDSRRIVLPSAAIRPILNLLHNSHSGVNKTITLAEYSPLNLLILSLHLLLPLISDTPCNMWV